MKNPSIKELRESFEKNLADGSYLKGKTLLGLFDALIGYTNPITPPAEKE